MSTLSLEKDIAFVKGVIEQLDRRLTKVENELAELRREFREEINRLRTELKAEINQLRAEVKSDIAQLRSEMRSEISQLRSEISQLRNEMLTMFRWTIGIMLGTWISVIIPLLLKVLGFI